ncbi:MAG: hypothetical protein EAZ99_14790 [Alphaproteobacteria bacterium]|nr:MAG: hypothetical protein EAZ99_14790 [Alphaproteobacteria bacterium]
MIVCVCRRISDREVTSAVQRGARSVGEVFRSHGCQVQCGRCIQHMQGMLPPRTGACGAGAGTAAPTRDG